MSLRLPRREILIIAAAAVVSIVITLAVLVGSSNARAARSAPPGKQGKEPAAAAAPEALTLEDFILPDAPRPPNRASYYPFRPRLRQWSRELVDRFWVSPRQVAIRVVGALNDRDMEELFRDIR